MVLATYHQQPQTSLLSFFNFFIASNFMISATIASLCVPAWVPEPLYISHNAPLPMRISSSRHEFRIALSMSAPVMRRASAITAEAKHYNPRNPLNPFTLHLARTTPRHTAANAFWYTQGGGGRVQVPGTRRDVGHSTRVRGARMREHSLLFYHMLVPPAQAKQKFHPLTPSVSESLGRYCTPSKVSKMDL